MPTLRFPWPAAGQRGENRQNKTFQVGPKQAPTPTPPRAKLSPVITRPDQTWTEYVLSDPKTHLCSIELAWYN